MTEAVKTPETAARPGAKPEFAGFENDKKHRLGRRAFMLFFMKRIRIFIFLALVSIGIWYAVPLLPPEYGPWGVYAAKIVTLLAVAYFVVVFLETYLEYRYRVYVFTDEAFMMTSGYVMRTETAALYHQIQNVNIVRGPLDRLIGVSRIVIFMTGDKSLPENRLMLPGVGRTKAKYVQRELLLRARKHFNQNGPA
ncbi:MAG TPA: PH domain-containing protein [Candidatus Paceibacterota bacterium]|nr:PH domain-containing protein [Candidatus Paceibacterota bacterium]